MNQYNAARAAGYSELYAKAACRIERLEAVSLANGFEQAGLTDKAIIAHALEGLNAVKELVIDGKACGSSPDWQTRHRYFTTILKLTGRLKDAEVERVGESKIVVIYPSAPNNPVIINEPVKAIEGPVENRIEAVSSGVSTGNG